MALGGGYMTETSKFGGGAYQGQVTAAGGGLGLDIAIGGALIPGFILAGSIAVTNVGNATLYNDSRSNTVTNQPYRSGHDPQLTVLAMLLDVYPNPQGGFHFGGALGFASLRIRGDSDPDSSAESAGIGIVPHVGYEWWVSNYWGLGVLGKFTFAHTEGDYAANSGIKSNVAAATILFSATYN
jgi:hypothetical protein